MILNIEKLSLGRTDLSSRLASKRTLPEIDPVMYRKTLYLQQLPADKLTLGIHHRQARAMRDKQNNKKSMHAIRIVMAACGPQLLKVKPMRNENADADT